VSPSVTVSVTLTTTEPV